MTHDQWTLIITGAQATSRESLQNWLDSMALPWHGTLIVSLGILVGGFGLLRRKRLLSNLAVQAGTSAVMTVGLTTFALADGYYEIAKHVWLGAYTLQVSQWRVIVWIFLVIGTRLLASREHKSKRNNCLVSERSTAHGVNHLSLLICLVRDLSIGEGVEDGLVFVVYERWEGLFGAVDGEGG